MLQALKETVKKEGKEAKARKENMLRQQQQLQQQQQQQQQLFPSPAVVPAAVVGASDVAAAAAAGLLPGARLCARLAALFPPDAQTIAMEIANISRSIANNGGSNNHSTATTTTTNGVDAGSLWRCALCRADGRSATDCRKELMHTGVMCELNIAPAVVATAVSHHATATATATTTTAAAAAATVTTTAAAGGGGGGGGDVGANGSFGLIGGARLQALAAGDARAALYDLRELRTCTALARGEMQMTSPPFFPLLANSNHARGHNPAAAAAAAAAAASSFPSPFDRLQSQVDAASIAAAASLSFVPDREVCGALMGERIETHFRPGVYLHR